MSNNSMTIENYIIRGGENLNSPPKTYGNFSPNELKTFEHWHVKLGKDDTEKENYIECPADVNTRLFIRAFWSEPSGHRPVCYYVGLLVPRSLYEEAGEYFRINRGLCAISLLAVQRALESNKPIDVNIEWPLTRTAIGQPFEVLSNWKRYGEVEYCSNMNDLLSSISINIIDDWFSRLFVAVNPYQSDPAYHMVVSRKKPLPFKDRIIENTSFGTNQHVLKKNKSESSISSQSNCGGQMLAHSLIEKKHLPTKHPNESRIGLFVGLIGIIVGLIGIGIGAIGLRQLSCASSVPEIMEIDRRLSKMELFAPQWEATVIDYSHFSGEYRPILRKIKDNEHLLSLLLKEREMSYSFEHKESQFE